VDLKSFSDRTSRNVCGATLAPVLETIRAMRELGIWVEVTTLLIPGVNDGNEELTALAGWLASVDREMPWHVSAFFPAYKMLDVPPTPADTLHRAALIGRKAGLRYVYTGNRPGDPWENTTCPECGLRLIHRRGFAMLANGLVGGRCPACGTPIAGVWG
ncbi:MAG: radical SAM protein, partial [candidate division NC10 bacterium]|nr:radical SAM protein [candidate division NC10 bacterium]